MEQLQVIQSVWKHDVVLVIDVMVMEEAGLNLPDHDVRVVDVRVADVLVVDVRVVDVLVVDVLVVDVRVADVLVVDVLAVDVRVVVHLVTSAVGSVETLVAVVRELLAGVHILVAPSVQDLVFFEKYFEAYSREESYFAPNVDKP